MVIILPIPTGPPVMTSITQHLSHQPCSVPYLDLLSTHQRRKHTQIIETNWSSDRLPHCRFPQSQARRSPAPLHSKMADVNSVPHNFRKSAEDPRIFSAAE